MQKLKDFVHRNPARVAAFVSSLVAIVVAFFAPDMPTEPAVVFVLSALGLGEFAQRVENKKTAEALFAEPEDVEELD